ncbi:hypothetical protein DOM22_01190 [Bdellovibrio sp. ZAP7]|nr:hypothetical protein DOM22_01190 [Bdellovibrio sp. ZAP7]
MSGLQYFRSQLLTDLDRRDSKEKLLTAWKEFQKTSRGSIVLEVFEQKEEFWSAVLESVGVYTEAKPKQEALNTRTLRTEEFLCKVASKIDSTCPDGLEKRLMLFGLWYLEAEAIRGRSYRNQKRIEIVYRFLHPRLKTLGVLDEFREQRDLAEAVRHFVKGSLY